MNRRIMPDIVKDQSICRLPTTASVQDGARQMAADDVAALVVADDTGGMVGIVTERDLTRRVLAEGRDAATTSLGDIMTKDPDTLAPDDSAVEALELMRMRRYRHLPVVDGGQVVGMVSIRDLYDAVKDELERGIRETEAFVFGDRYGA
ncbi:MAG: CBS domain-containing protein [Hyphomicrobiales bacterium]|nr:CBS domain-containing protein [Hyphomicrobiales bacterium]MCP5370668.1 CBS domain-containing protein [Hyphomicrobiales bacterium]